VAAQQKRARSQSTGGPSTNNTQLQQQERKHALRQTVRKEKGEGPDPNSIVGDPQQGQMATGHNIGTPMAANEEASEALASTHRLKLKPPTCGGNYATFQEWKYEFTAYMGIQDNIYPHLLARAQRATTVLTHAELTAAAGTLEEAERWIQLANNLKHILISTTSAAAATVCRQHQAAMCREVYRQLCQHFSLPLGTRSMGYLTKLLKPTFNHNNFEESFPTWEFEVERHERDNHTQLPDQVRIAVLMNETTGPLQQHLQNARQAPTYAMIREIITEHYRTTAAFARLQQQASSVVSTNYSGVQAPTEISATGKGNKEQLQRKATRKRAQRKRKRKRKRIRLQQRLRQGKRTRKRKTSVATSERNRQRTRKEQRSQQPRKRKEPNGSMLQM